MADSGDVQYRYQSMKVIRGREASTIQKMRSDGWELHSRDQGRLRTEMTFRRVRKPTPWRLVAALAVVALIVIAVVGGVVALQGEDDVPGEATTSSSSERASEERSENATSPSQEPSETVTATTSPIGPAVTVECYNNDTTESIAFTIERLNPDFSEAWSTPIPLDKKSGISFCSEVDTGLYGGGPKLTPVTAVEQTIWNGAQQDSMYRRDRSTLTDVYVQCVEHDTRPLLKDYPGSPNLVEEAETMLVLCPDHPNAEAIRKRIVIQGGFAQQMQNGETISGNDTYLVGQDVEPGTYRTFSAGGVFACTWSRRNSSDRPIEQGGAHQGRVHTITVSIAASDHSFYTEQCGVWFRLK